MASRRVEQNQDFKVMEYSRTNPIVQLLVHVSSYVQSAGYSFPNFATWLFCTGPCKEDGLYDESDTGYS